MVQGAQPLPPNLARTTDPQCITSYNLIIEAETIQRTALNEAVEKAKSKGEKDDSKVAVQSLAQGLTAIRVLGHLLQQVPSNTGVKYLAHLIKLLASHTQCLVQSSLIELGEFYIRYFLGIFRRSDYTRPPSDQPSRDSFEDDHMTNLERNPKNHADAKSKALIRDGYRCAVSHVYDHICSMKVPAAQQLIQHDTNAQATRTHACHIIPEGLLDLQEVQPTGIIQALGNRFVKERKVHESSTTFAVLQLFDDPDILGLVPEEKIHDLSNIITMSVNLHDLFDTLDLWFEPTGEPNEYHLCVQNAISRPLDPFHKRVEKVTFRSQPNLPPPSPEYLALHATCCKVAHMSGAAELLEDIDRDLEQLKSLQTMNPEALNQLNSALKLGVRPRSQVYKYRELERSISMD